MTLHPFLAKIMENFEKCYLFYSLKKCCIELKCIFLNNGIWHHWPLPPTNYGIFHNFFYSLNEGVPYTYNFFYFHEYSLNNDNSSNYPF